MHLRTRLVSAGVAAALAALAASLLAVVGPASAAPADPVEVTPSALPDGATPTVAWYRSAGDEIVRPGRRPVNAAGADSRDLWLLNARGGWLRHTYGNGTSFVGTNGKARRLGPKSGFEAQVVARDGRTFVDRVVRYDRSDTRKWSTVVRVRRTHDGKVLRMRTFKQTGVQVRAATSSVVALTVVSPRRGNAVWTTEYWNQRTGRLRSAFGSHPVPGSPNSDFYRAPAAALSHHLIAVRERGFESVRNSRTGRELWRTSGDERTYRFSPDGTRVVTFGDFYNGYEDGFSYQVMRIRDARTGAVLATYRGLFLFETYDSPVQGPVWESESSVLVLAYDAITLDEEGYGHPSGPAWIRCTAAGSCQLVPIDPSTDYVTIPRSS